MFYVKTALHQIKTLFIISLDVQSKPLLDIIIYIMKKVLLIYYTNTLSASLFNPGLTYLSKMCYFQSNCRWSNAEGFSYCDTFHLFWRYKIFRCKDYRNKKCLILVMVKLQPQVLVNFPPES